MASLIDDLNDLLRKTRGEFEAAKSVADEIADCDPDIERGLEDIVEAERWSSSGLYHRITQLDSTPNLLTADYPARVATKIDLRDKIRALCGEQRSFAQQVRKIINHHDLDEPTRELLDEMHRLHKRNEEWCEGILLQWEE